MNDSLRSAKRRRLNSCVEEESHPSNESATTPTKSASGTLKRPTRRSGPRGSLHQSDIYDAAFLHERRDIGDSTLASASPAVNGSLRKKRASIQKTDAELYDNIDEAYASKTPTRALRSRLTGSGKAYGAPQRASSTPGTARGRKTAAAGVGGGNDSISGHTASAEGKTSAKTLRSARRSGGRAMQPVDGADVSLERKKKGSLSDEDETAVTPSRRTSRRAGRAQEPDTGEDTPSKPAHANQSGETLRTRRTGAAKPAVEPQTNGTSGREARRQANQTDNLGHAGGEDDEHSPFITRRGSGAVTQRLSLTGLPTSVQRTEDSEGFDREDEARSTCDGEADNASNVAKTLRRRRNRTDHLENAMEEHDNLLTGNEADSSTRHSASDGTTSPFVSSVTTPLPLIAEHGKLWNGVTHATNNHSHAVKSSDDGPSLLKNIVLEKLTQKRPIPLVGLDDEYAKVHQLVEQTVVAGESNSMLIIGARGSGKSALVRKVLREVSRDSGGSFHVVRLNGFIQTDDKLALREIWRQLGREMDVEEDGLGKNYADTLTTLLALLSHPSEISSGESDRVAKAVVFVMDEFDLFAARPRQTLLYNLFDIAQSRKAPIAVLGLTTRMGVVESLEKRVKSRFSHRYVHLPLAKSFAAFQEVCTAALLVRPEELGFEERTMLMTPRRKTEATAEPSGSDVLTTWNSGISQLFDSPTFTTTCLAPHYHRTKSVPAALTSLLLPLTLLPPASLAPTPSHFPPAAATATLQPPDSKLALLSALSDLQLGLLIAAARLAVVLDADACNFNMAHAELVALAARARAQSAAAGALAAGASAARVWRRAVARAEWDRLLACELLLPVAGAGAGAGVAATDMVRCDVALEEIAPSVPGLDRGMERWCRQI